MKRLINLTLTIAALSVFVMAGLSKAQTSSHPQVIELESGETTKVVTGIVTQGAGKFYLLQNNEAGQSFEFDGFYVISGRPPRGFENLDPIISIGGDPNSAYGYVATKRGVHFKFTAISVSRGKITFTTRSLQGISYKFDGRFLTDKPTQAPSDEVVLEGALVKLQRGKQNASASVRLTYFPGD
jgi:hypothetical protein